ncbi:hypothetical protein MKW92_014656 [Papaver armeniacum]|nr:hypothetical protein MKW92_014656 [Papaver armeniacum]
MATLELYRSSIVGMCLIETLNEMVYNGTQVKSKVTIKGHLKSYWSHDDNAEGKQNVGKVKIVACNSKLFP